MSKALWCSLSICGLLLGTLFYAASLTPTLLPRTYLAQGVVSGCSIAAGYGIGVFGHWLWAYMELPQPRARILQVTRFAAAAACAIIAVLCLWQAARWQNSIRELMQIGAVVGALPPQVTLVALAVFAIGLVLARLLRLMLRFVGMRARFLPRRVSNVIGAVAAVTLFWSIIDGVLFRVALRGQDASYQRLDKLIEPETRPPADPLKTGSGASLLA